MHEKLHFLKRVRGSGPNLTIGQKKPSIQGSMAKRAVRGQKAIKSVPKRTPNINTVPRSPVEEGPGYKIDVRELSSGKHGDDPYGLGAEKPMLLAQDVDSLQNAGAILDGSF